VGFLGLWLVLWFGLVGVGIARAQSLPDRMADNVDTAAVDTYVKAQVALLAGAKPQDPDGAEAARRAREELIHNALPPPQQHLSAAFLDAYAGSIDTALQAALDAKPSPSDTVRLNIAIVAAEVSANAENSRLSGTVEKCLADPCEAVVLWGIKGAGYILPFELSLPPPVEDKLMPGVMAAVSRYPQEGEIARAAYQAFTPEKGDLTDDQFKQVFTTILPSLQSLMSARMTGYEKGIPADPAAALTAVRYLSDLRFVVLEDDDQQVASMQALLELISDASQRAIGAEKDDRTGLINVINLSAEALSVVMKQRNPADETAVDTELTALYGVRSQSTDQALKTATDAAVAAVVKQIPKLQAPAQLPTAAATQATTAPTSGPTTGAAAEGARQPSTGP
jgi:hypothetical protein